MGRGSCGSEAQGSKVRIRETLCLEARSHRHGKRDPLGHVHRRKSMEAKDGALRNTSMLEVD